MSVRILQRFSCILDARITLQPFGKQEMPSATELQIRMHVSFQGSAAES